MIRLVRGLQRGDIGSPPGVTGLNSPAQAALQERATREGPETPMGEKDNCPVNQSLKHLCKTCLKQGFDTVPKMGWVDPTR